MVEYYLSKMFHWYLLLGNFVICFWINLVLKIAFDTCFSFDLICLFWVNSVYLLYCISRNFCIGVDIKFDIWLNIICSRWLLISFARKFCNLFLDQFGFWELLTHVLVLTWSVCFGSIVFICYVFQQEVLLNGVDIFDIWLKIFHWYLLLGNFVICFWINLVFKIFTFDTCFSFDLICLFLGQ